MTSKKREYEKTKLSYENLIINALDSIHTRDFGGMIQVIMVLDAYLEPLKTDEYRDNVKPILDEINNTPDFRIMFNKCIELLKKQMELIREKEIISVKKEKEVIPARSPYKKKKSDEK